MQRVPPGTLKVSKIAGKPSSGSRIVSESRLARSFEKNDITEPTARHEYAGCATLLSHSAASIAWLDVVIWRDMLMIAAPASIAFRTPCMHLLRSQVVAMYATFVVSLQSTGCATLSGCAVFATLVAEFYTLPSTLLLPCSR